MKQKEKEICQHSVPTVIQKKFGKLLIGTESLNTPD